MLVLSRGRNDKVVFPSLGITVEILRIAGSKVRIGIDAPAEVPVHRHEVAQRCGESGDVGRSGKEAKPELSHGVRNRLHAAILGLHVLHCKFEQGDTLDAEPVIFNILNELQALEAQLQPSPKPAPARPTTQPRRALVVEDDENECQLLAGYLRMSGFEVDTAMDGLQAMVQLTKTQKPDVVLLDMRLPRFDGRKTITAIRCNPAYRGLKVFAVSGTAQSEMEIPIGPQGVDRWFSKPINPQHLVAEMRRELDPTGSERTLDAAAPAT